MKSSVQLVTISDCDVKLIVGPFRRSQCGRFAFSDSGDCPVAPGPVDPPPPLLWFYTMLRPLRVLSRVLIESSCLLLCIRLNCVIRNLYFPPGRPWFILFLLQMERFSSYHSFGVMVFVFGSGHAAFAVCTECGRL